MRSSSQFRISWLALVLVLLGAGPALAQTYPRDVGGAVAPPCVSSDGAGNFNVCDPTHPIPMAVVAGTTPSADPTGFGRSWQLTRSSQGVFNAAANIDIGAVFLDQFTVPAWEFTGGNITPYRSGDAARTFAQIGSVTAGPVGPTGVRAALVAPNSNWILGVGSGTFITSSSHVTWVAPTLTGVGFNGVTAGVTLAAQGGTVLGVINDSAPNPTKIGRSTDNGVTFNVAIPAAFTATFAALQQSLATPSASVWIIAGSDATNNKTYRSIDDGITWTQVDAFTSTASPNQQTAGCATPTICFVSDGRLIRRSTDAGVTWATILDTGINAQRFSAFVTFGSGVTVALADGTGAQSFYRTVDNGVTWTPINNPTATCSGGRTLTQSTNSGRGLAVFAKTGGNVACIIYSQPIGAGVFNGNGQQVVAQGDAASPTSAWPFAITNAAGTQQAAVKAPSTAPVATDPGVVTEQSPNFPSSVNGGLPSMPIQGATSFNTQVTSAANATNVFTCTAVAGQRCVLRGGFGSVSAGTASITVQDGATTIWSSPGALAALSSTTAVNLFPGIPASGIAGLAGNAMTVTIGAAGVGNTSTAAIQMDRQ